MLWNSLLIIFVIINNCLSYIQHNRYASHVFQTSRYYYSRNQIPKSYIELFARKKKSDSEEPINSSDDKPKPKKRTAKSIEPSSISDIEGELFQSSSGKAKTDSTKGRKKKQSDLSMEKLDTTLPNIGDDDEMLKLERALAKIKPSLADLEDPTFEELEASLRDMDDLDLFMSSMPNSARDGSNVDEPTDADIADFTGTLSQLDSLFDDSKGKDSKSKSKDTKAKKGSSKKASSNKGSSSSSTTGATSSPSSSTGFDDLDGYGLDDMPNFDFSEFGLDDADFEPPDDLFLGTDIDPDSLLLDTVVDPTISHTIPSSSSSASSVSNTIAPLPNDLHSKDAKKRGSKSTTSDIPKLDSNTQSFPTTGTFSSKEMAGAKASASAATRAASAKRKKELMASGLSKAAAAASVKREQELALQGGGLGGGLDDDKLIIDGVEIDSKDAQQGVPPQPLEEFRRLMDSLGAEYMFGDDVGPGGVGGMLGGLEGGGVSGMEGGGDSTDVEKLMKNEYLTEAERIQLRQIAYTQRKQTQELELNEEIASITEEEKLWHEGLYYKGGDPAAGRGGSRGSEMIELFGMTEAELTALLDNEFNEHCEAAQYRMTIVAAVTPNEDGSDSLAMQVVAHVFDYLKNHTNNDPRIEFQTMVYTNEDDDSPMESLKDIIQMWCESYNTYHLIDGAAMKAAWGGVMPDIILSPNNLEAILNQVLFALEEDDGTGTILTPRLRAVRLRGGAKEMVMGYNTETIDSEFSVVSVR